MHYTSWDDFKRAHPNEAELIEQKRDENRFMQSMFDTISRGGKVSTNMMRALQRWLESDARKRGVPAPSSATTARLPKQGEWIRVSLRFYKAELLTNKSTRRSTNAFSFRAGIDKWAGRVETGDANVIDDFAAAGLRINGGLGVYHHNGVIIDIVAKVKWIGGRDGSFVILTDPKIMGYGDSVSETAFEETDPPGRRRRRSTEEALAERERTKSIESEIEASDAERTSLVGDWKSALGSF